MNFLQKMGTALIKVYQRIGALRFKKHCRFEPTCSNYAVLALKKYGFFKGLLKTFWRILRCSPLSRGGVDLP